MSPTEEDRKCAEAVLGLSELGVDGDRIWIDGDIKAGSEIIADHVRAQVEQATAIVMEEITAIRDQNAALTAYIARSLKILPQGEMAKDWHAEGVRLLHRLEGEGKSK